MPPVRKTSVSFYLPCRSPTVTPPSSLAGLSSCWSPCRPSCHTPTYFRCPHPFSTAARITFSRQNSGLIALLLGTVQQPLATCGKKPKLLMMTPYNDVPPPVAQTASPTLPPVVALPLSARPLIPQPTWPSLPPLLQHATPFRLLSLYASRFLYVEYSPHLPQARPFS